MTNTIEIKLHYFLYTEGIHVMDAHVHNECHCCPVKIAKYHLSSNSRNTVLDIQALI